MSDIIAKSARLVLRKTEANDLHFVVAAESDKENRRFVTQQSLMEHRSMLEDADVLHMIIEHDDEKVGYIIMSGLQNKSRSVELKRIVITAKGKGFGREAVGLCKGFAFEKLNAHRLWLDVVHYNKLAYGLYISEGFVQEGILRECDLFEGRYASMVIMSMLEREYRAQRDTTR